MSSVGRHERYLWPWSAASAAFECVLQIARKRGRKPRLFSDGNQINTTTAVTSHTGRVDPEACFQEIAYRLNVDWLLFVHVTEAGTK